MKHEHYDDRSLAITEHAVERYRERAGLLHLGAEECRLALARALRDEIDAGAAVEPHWIAGQSRVRIHVLGVPLVVIVGRDVTGWSRSGHAVVTVLTADQLEQSMREYARRP